MTPPGPGGPSPARRPNAGGGAGTRPPEVAGGRRAVATLAGLISGLFAAALLLALGLLMYRRLLGGSESGLVAVLLIFGAAGAYAGWLLGVIVYGAVRGDAGEPARD